MENSQNSKISELHALNESLKEEITQMESESGNSSAQILQIQNQLTETCNKLKMRSQEVEKLQNALKDSEETINKFAE